MKIWIRYFHQICTIYTISALLLLLLNVALGNSPTRTTINTAAFLWLIVFAAVLAAANLCLVEGKFSYPARVVLHCLLTVAGAFCLLYLPSSQGSASSGKLMMLLLMLLLYWIVMALYLVLVPRKARTVERTEASKKEAEPYRSLFGTKRD